MLLLSPCSPPESLLSLPPSLRRWVKQQKELAREAQNPVQGPKLDLGFKEGQTIKLSIAVRSALVVALGWRSGTGARKAQQRSRSLSAWWAILPACELWKETGLKPDGKRSEGESLLLGLASVAWEASKWFSMRERNLFVLPPEREEKGQFLGK